MGFFMLAVKIPARRLVPESFVVARVVALARGPELQRSSKLAKMTLLLAVQSRSVALPRPNGWSRPPLPLPSATTNPMQANGLGAAAREKKPRRPTHSGLPVIAAVVRWPERS